MRETQPDRGNPERPQTYRVNVAQPVTEPGKQIAMLAVDMNRLLGDIAARLERIEKRLSALEKE